MKTLRLTTLVSFLDRELGLREFPGDESANGLQVEGSDNVSRIGVAVDACDSVFRSAADKDIDFLLVHHGLIWGGGIRSVSGLMKKRIQLLLRSNMSLYACHLPLDWHPHYGNNARLLDMLGIRKTGEFGEYHGKRIGQMGKLDRETPLKAFAARTGKLLSTEVRVFDFGRKVRKVGVVSGGGWSALHDAEHLDIDTFLTGEPSHSAYALAEELKVNLVFAGHYATETPGVKAVGTMLMKKFGVEAVFIDRPTGL